jgi:hypothetical protein
MSSAGWFQKASRVLVAFVFLFTVVTPTVVLPAPAAYAANCRPATAIERGWVGVAWCRSGSGFIQVVLRCVRQSDFKPYTRTGPRVWSSGAATASVAYCNGEDAAVRATYRLG